MRLPPSSKPKYWGFAHAIAPFWKRALTTLLVLLRAAFDLLFRAAWRVIMCCASKRACHAHWVCTEQAC
jgi:hypothetical protein